MKTLPLKVHPRDLSRPVTFDDLRAIAAESCGPRCVCRGAGTLVILSSGQRTEKQCERARAHLERQCSARLIAIGDNLFWRFGCAPETWASTSRFIASIEADRTRASVASCLTSWASAVNSALREASEEETIRQLVAESERRAA